VLNKIKRSWDVKCDIKDLYANERICISGKSRSNNSNDSISSIVQSCVTSLSKPYISIKLRYSQIERDLNNFGNA